MSGVDAMCTCGGPVDGGAAVWILRDAVDEFNLCGDCLRQMLADYGPDPDRIEENLTAAERANFDVWDEQMGAAQ